jgi:hypothetical protein
VGGRMSGIPAPADIRSKQRRWMEYSDPRAVYIAVKDFSARMYKVMIEKMDKVGRRCAFIITIAGHQTDGCVSI